MFKKLSKYFLAPILTLIISFALIYQPAPCYSGLAEDIIRISESTQKIYNFVHGTPGTVETDGGEIINLAMAAQLADEKVDQLSIFNPRGMWATATAYVFRDLVEYDSAIYMVLSDHTSGVFADDLSADKLAIYQDTIATSALITSLANTLEGEGVDLVARAKKYVSEVDDLNTTSPGTHTIVYARCFATIGDGGHGDFEWDAVSTATPIRGMIHQVTGNPTGRWIRQLSGFVTPQMFGAKADGIADDTLAIKAAFAFSASKHVGFGIFILDGGLGRNSGVPAGTSPRVHFPNGHYRLTDSVYVQDYVEVTGEKSYLRMESKTLSIFNTGVVNIRISGLIFDGGKYHIRIGGNSYRPEACFVTIKDCMFRHAQTRSIITDRSGILPAPGYPMTLQIENCKAYGCPFLESHTNGTFVTDCWIAWDVSAEDHDDVPLFVHSDILVLTNIVEVPYAPVGMSNVNYTPRIKTDNLDSTSTIIKNCRWGGEATKTPLAQITHKDSAFIMDSSATFGVSLGYWLILDQLPKLVSVTNSRGGEVTGFVDTWGIWLNSNNINVSDVGDYTKFRLELDTKYVSAYDKVLSNDKTVQGGSTFPFIAQQYNPAVVTGVDITQSNLAPGDGHSWWGTGYDSNDRSGCSGYLGNNDILGRTSGYFTTTGPWYFHLQADGFIAPSAGIYTMSMYVHTTAEHQATVRMNGPSSATVCTRTLMPGTNLISGTFYHDGVTATNPEVLFSGSSSGATVTIGMISITEGAMISRWSPPGAGITPSALKQYYRSSAPVAGTWRIGELVWNTAPTADGTLGWVCTAAGTPGTWKVFGTIAP